MAGLEPVPVAAQENTEPEITRPAILVPGLTGSRLRNRSSKRWIWGTTLRFFFPRDRGLELALPITDSEDDGEAVDAILELKLLGYKRRIYRPLVESLESAGYRFGSLRRPGAEDTLFVFAYDWRRANLDAVRSLHAELDRLAALHRKSFPDRSEEPRFDLICQSNAARICRYLIKYGTVTPEQADDGQRASHPSYAIDRVILVGASNGGALRSLHELNRGRRYVPLVGRFLGPESLFTLRPLFEDLPFGRSDLFVDPDGQPLAITLEDPRTWVNLQWSLFHPRFERRLRKARWREKLGSRQRQRDYLSAQLQTARRLYDLLAADGRPLHSSHYYLIENESLPTPTRAVVEERKGRWRTRFSSDKKIKKNHRLEPVTATSGDGHATIESQRALSAAEQLAIRDRWQASGSHFAIMVQRATHDRILQFLGAVPAVRQAP